MAKIIHNIARCLKCGDIIESLSRHDFVTCECKNLSVDGGLDYLRRCNKTDEWEELSVRADLLEVEGESVRAD